MSPQLIRWGGLAGRTGWLIKIGLFLMLITAACFVTALALGVVLPTVQPFLQGALSYLPDELPVVLRCLAWAVLGSVLWWRTGTEPEVPRLTAWHYPTEDTEQSTYV